MKFYCFRTISRSKGTFVPKGISIGFQMAEKNANRQTHTHFRIYTSRDRFARSQYILQNTNILPKISTYINTKMCVCVCLCIRVFLGHLESDWDTLWHKCAFWPRNGSKTIKFQKSYFSQSYCPFLYCFRTHSGPKSNFVPKGFPIGFQMAEKNANKQTDTHTHIHFRIYISRD